MTQWVYSRHLADETVIKRIFIGDELMLSLHGSCNSQCVIYNNSYHWNSKPNMPFPIPNYLRNLWMVLVWCDDRYYRGFENRTKIFSLSNRCGCGLSPDGRYGVGIPPSLGFVGGRWRWVISVFSRAATTLACYWLSGYPLPFSFSLFFIIRFLWGNIYHQIKIGKFLS